MGSKKGQVTIFIILGIVIVSGIVGVIILSKDIQTEAPVKSGTEGFIQQCVKDVVEESVTKILDGGGEINPDHFVMYNGMAHNYLCYQEDFYSGCYNTHPNLEKSIELEIREDTKEGVQNCFNKFRTDLEDKGFTIGGGATNYSVDLLPGKIEITLKKKINAVKGGSSQNFNEFDTKILSPIYELVEVARNIVNGESQYCAFEYVGYMLLYPEYDIRKINYNTNKIYRIIDRRSGSEFKFAVRSCALPPGI